MLNTMVFNLLYASAETLYMVFVSTCLACVLGLPLGTLLYSFQNIQKNLKIYNFLSSILNIFRSLPFIILLVALIPLTRHLVGTSIGMNAAIVPLTIGAIPFFARLVATAYQDLPLELINTGRALGASTLQIIRHILIPEARPALIRAVTLTAITLVNYSAMAGTVGAGGLGTLAINYGYQRFDTFVMTATVVILILMVQAIQTLGDYVANYFEYY